MSVTPTRCYLAGPMRGIKDFNFPAFHEAAAFLRSKGWEVFNPAEKDLEKHGAGIEKSPTGCLKTAEKKGFNLREALACDLEFVCLHAEALVMLPGWKDSKGARAEKATAHALGIPVYFYKELR